ncbi:MAG TPA: hypothetical protein PKK99_09915, partial [Bacteroidia bacterium]|nr:hypothetical protein [Bacteroidia bacterium]
MTTVQNSIGIVNEQTGFVELSTTVHGHHLPRTVQVPINDPYVMAKAVAAWKAKSESLLLVFEGEELIKYNAHRNSFFEKKVDFPEDLWVVNVIFFSKGWLSFSGNKNISSETFDLLKRFGAVFEQTYTRFNDLKQVEEQARESQIEVSLERVRATSMAMHRSQDLNEVIKVVCEQLVHLGLKFDGTNFIKVMEDGSWQMWTINPAQKYPSLIYMPYKDIHSINILNATLEKDEEQIAVLFSKAEKDEFFQYFFSNTVARMTPEDRKAYVLNGSGWSLTIFVVKNIVLNIFNYDTIPFSDSDNAIVRRFAKVFEQSYIRFLDLQKAEAQAREAQIEAALEKVRSRTLAMQKSDELAETAAVMFKQLIHLGIEPNRLYIILFKD